MNCRVKPVVQILAASMLGASLPTAVVRADDPAQVAQQAADKLPAFTKSREAAALVFIQHQRPELLELLKMVQKNNSTEYEKAIRQFFDWSEKLADAKGQDNGAISLALQSWQVHIQMQILGAQMLKQPDRADELRGQLKKLIEHSVDIQASQIEQQIVQAEHQLEGLRKQREKLAETRDATIHNRLQEFERLLARHRERATLQAEFEQAMRQIQSAAERRQQEGADVSRVVELMQQVGPLVQEGRIDEARIVLKRAQELLRE